MNAPPQNAAEIRLVTTTSLVLACTTLALASLRWLNEGAQWPLWILLGGAAGFFAIAAVARGLARPTPLAIPLVGTLTLGALSIVEGGLWSDASPWLPFVPLVAVMFGAKRMAYVFFGGITAILATLLVMHMGGSIAPPSGGHSPVLHFGSLLGASVFGTYLALRFAEFYVTKTESLRTQAHHDVMTGLLNRRGLDAATIQKDAAVGVLYIDLDGLKGVNDALGHDVGDTAIGEAASRINGALRDSDICARVGGDEFVVLLPGIASHAAAERCAERLVAALRERIEFSPSVSATLQGSVGVAYRPVRTATTLDDLIAAADSAMYRAKRAGGDRFVSAPLDASALADLSVTERSTSTGSRCAERQLGPEVAAAGPGTFT